MLNYIIFGLITLLAACVSWYIVQFWKYNHLNQFRGPMPLPFIGNILHFRDANCVLDRLVNAIKEYGSIVKVWFGSEFYLLISDAELSKVTFKNSKITPKDKVYNLFERWFGLDGQFLTNGDIWRKYRSISLQVFHIDVIKNRINDLNSQCGIFIKNLVEITKYQEIINMEPIYQALLLDMYDVYAFDINMEAQTKQHGYTYLQAFNYVSHNFMTRLFSIWKRNKFLYQFSSDYKKESEALKIIYGTADQIINKHRKIIEDDNIEVITSNIAQKQRYKFFIDHFMQATINGRPLTKNELYHSINASIMAAIETTLATISWLTYEISQNQEVQNKLVKEIWEVFGNEADQDFTMTDINQLKYMDLVIKETLRYYSPVPIFARRLTEDIVFRGTTIPKNTGLIYVISGLHRSNEYFQDPDKFYPERFSEEDKLTPYSFLGFSAGDHYCPGMKLAMVMMKLTLVHLLRNFVLSSSGPMYQPQAKMGLVLSSQNGFNVRISSRV